MESGLQSDSEIGMSETPSTSDGKSQQRSDDQIDVEKVFVTLTCRGTQTILTSRGLMSLNSLDAVSIGPETNATKSAPATSTARQLKSSATQATPRVSFCGARLLATTSADCPRSPVENLR
ncbi:hypothetical protein QAD02_019819 [Eretmocerus hayati]|uniref:Uncharacterized protein n=1 Tax=Eretmocerus hayati TaxID=131215 RepID=A0ACC2PNX5_9HYME|nr:hypothetical protein QAD02_019819 [Eretmocerus hayati]